jgi:hypothetical protein
LDPLLASYEAAPYDSKPIAHADVASMETMAFLHGLQSAPADGCRVLELGCASGEHLMAMASQFRRSEFRGIDLARTLNSRSDTVDAALQLLLTPLTTFSMTTSFQRDRFDAAPERNSDTLRLLPALQFDPTSLIRGSVAVGYRRFRPLTPEESFTGT